MPLNTTRTFERVTHREQAFQASVIDEIIASLTEEIAVSRFQIYQLSAVIVQRDTIRLTEFMTCLLRVGVPAAVITGFRTGQTMICRSERKNSLGSRCFVGRSTLLSPFNSSVRLGE